MGIKLVCPCMRSCCMGRRLCGAALQELRVLLIVTPGSALPSTDALNEALCLLLLELSGSLCSTKWLVMLYHARQTCLQCSRSLRKKSEKIAQDSPGCHTTGLQAADLHEAWLFSTWEDMTGDNRCSACDLRLGFRRKAQL